MTSAFLWGLLAASSLVLGGLLASWVPLGKRTLGVILAFGAGVLLSATAYELVFEAITLAKGSGYPRTGLFRRGGHILLGRPADRPTGRRASELGQRRRASDAGRSARSRSHTRWNTRIRRDRSRLGGRRHRQPGHAGRGVYVQSARSRRGHGWHAIEWLEPDEDLPALDGDCIGFALLPRRRVMPCSATFRAFGCRPSRRSRVEPFS